MTAFRVAVIGSGPSGFFAADALLKANNEAVIHMFERLPTPFGLVRSGVAPDHQNIKQVVRVFENVARNPQFSFLGNVEIGKDVTLDKLRRCYDAVVLAYGASGGVKLSIPGADLEHSFTATQFVGWYNGHPNYVDLPVRLDCEAAVVVGHGNVAIDVARILLSDVDRLAKTDIADHALEILRESKIRKLHLVGRRGPLQTSFTTAELRELLFGDEISPHIDINALNFTLDEIAFVERPSNTVIRNNIRVMRDAAIRSLDIRGRKELHLTFLMTPYEVVGHKRVSGVVFKKNKLAGPVDQQDAVSTNDHYHISAGLLVSSIGFRGRPLDGVPFDTRSGVVPNVGGRVLMAASEDLAPLYVVGWIKRGPSGVIGTNKADAIETIQCLLEDHRDGRGVRRLKARELAGCDLPRSVDFAGWGRIDDIERASGGRSGRPRCKIVDVEMMLRIAASA